MIIETRAAARRALGFTTELSLGISKNNLRGPVRPQFRLREGYHALALIYGAARNTIFQPALGFICSHSYEYHYISLYMSFCRPLENDTGRYLVFRVRNAILAYECDFL